jgi:hypothetical protein
MVVKLNTVVIYHGAAVIYRGISTIENVSSYLNYSSIFKALAPEVVNVVSTEYVGHLSGIRPLTVETHHL